MIRLPHNSIMRTRTSLNSAGKREAKPIPEDNQPARFELFLLGDGEKKVTEEADTREYSSFLQHGEFPHQAAMRSNRTAALVRFGTGSLLLTRLSSCHFTTHRKI